MPRKEVAEGASRTKNAERRPGPKPRRKPSQQGDLLSWMFGCGTSGGGVLERSGSLSSHLEEGSSRSSSSDSRGSYQQPGCFWARQGCLLNASGDEDFQDFGRWCTGNSAPAARFHLIPRTGWDPHVQKLKCSARNVLAPNDSGHIPEAPEDCWLLPSSDAMAVTIATHRKALRGMGWKVLSCEPAAVKRLGNKSALQTTAKALGLSGSLPRAYATSRSAEYPCILKAAVGQHGKDVYIVESAEEVDNIASDGLGNHWVLQELVRGPMEYSVSLLVFEGAILDAVCTEYEYAKDIYVWPEVEELGRHSHDDIPKEHLQVMEKFVHEYSGICNFNYKVRPTGEMCIFEVNTRIGADLACDVPRRRARKLFETLDERCTRAARLGLTERRFSVFPATAGSKNSSKNNNGSNGNGNSNNGTSNGKRKTDKEVAVGGHGECWERPLLPRNAGQSTTTHPNLLTITGQSPKMIPGVVSTSAPGSPISASLYYTSPLHSGSMQLASPTASPTRQQHYHQQQYVQQPSGYPAPLQQQQQQQQQQHTQQTRQVLRSNLATSLAAPTPPFPSQSPVAGRGGLLTLGGGLTPPTTAKGGGLTPPQTASAKPLFVIGGEGRGGKVQVA